jgi:hypothetical protein
MRAFYVYDLVDPRDGSTFYVGKGTGSRKSEHVKDAMRGKKSRKCSRIRDILAAGLVVGEIEVATFFDQDEAYEYEAARIAEIGLDNLTNVLPGGHGGIAYLDYQLRRSGDWTTGVVKGLAAVLRLPKGSSIKWGPYDISFVLEMAHEQAHRFIAEVGSDKAANTLGRYGVTLEQAMA